MFRDMARQDTSSGKSIWFYDPDSNGKNYYLISKSAVYLDDSNYPSARRKTIVFKWKPEDMDTLKIGDSQHGKRRDDLSRGCWAFWTSFRT